MRTSSIDVPPIEPDRSATKIDFGGRRGVGKVRRKREGDRPCAVGIALDPRLRCVELRGIDEQNEIPVERRIALRQRDRRAFAVDGNGYRV